MHTENGLNVLITGGAGYIGSHTANLLAEKGYRVTVVDDLSTGFRESLSSDIEFHLGSILDRAFINQIFKKKKYDAVIHFAAKLIVSESILDPQSYYINNLLGSLNIFGECISHKVPKIIFSSTAAVYGESSSKPVSENDKCAPINPYGQSKLAVENMLQDFGHAHDLSYVILRYFNVAGGSLDLSNGLKTRNATHLMKVAAEAASGKRDNVDICGVDYPTKDGTCIRDYIHVLDLAEAHVSALEYLKNGGNSEIFNCGYGSGYSVLEVLNAMKKESGVNFKTHEAKKRVGDPAIVVSDNKKILEKLNWKPQLNNLNLICKNAYDWELKI